MCRSRQHNNLFLFLTLLDVWISSVAKMLIILAHWSGLLWRKMMKIVCEEKILLFPEKTIFSFIISSWASKRWRRQTGKKLFQGLLCQIANWTSCCFLGKQIASTRNVWIVYLSMGSFKGNLHGVNSGLIPVKAIFCYQQMNKRSTYYGEYLNK